MAETKPGVFFPEPMDKVTIFCPLESTYQCIRAVSDFGYLQFDDYNSGTKSINKRYSEAFLQAEEAERSLRVLHQALEIHSALPDKPSMDLSTQELLDGTNDFDFNDISAKINAHADDFRERKKIFDDLQHELDLREQKLACLKFFRDVVHHHNQIVFQNNTNADSDLNSGTLLHSLTQENPFVLSIVGFIPVESSRSFATTVYRLSRRNVIIENGETQGNRVPYALFTSSASIMSRVKKVAESYGSYVFEFTQDEKTLNSLEEELMADLNQMRQIDVKTRNNNISVLREIASQYWTWILYIAKEKLTFTAMDYGDFEAVEGSVVYRGWCPTRLVPQLHTILDNVSSNGASPIPIHLDTESITLLKEGDEMPPTFIETNTFSGAFQTLNDAYGIPNYDELNGGAFYCTYPFLFGIMFGDMGHALFYILIAFAVLALDPIMKRLRIDLGEIGNAIFGFKWLLLFASLCAFYCGMIYNEAFGLPINMFGSHYQVNETRSHNATIEYYDKTDPSIYPFGMDPVWFFKDNELIFMNSYKMKLAVVMGMSQMVFGLFLGLINHIHRKDWIEIIVTWIPSFMYLVPFFGYLVVLIIKKWCTDFSTFEDPEKQKDGVNLIQVMISMVLNFGASDDTLELYGDVQWTIQKVILYIFLISIPLLLFARPIVDIIQKRGREDFNLLEIFVMNLIHVIELCLGALSHTASYLRLWALSLAHSQLSHVMHEELLIMTINTNSPVFVFIGFAAYAAMSVAILLGMEAFSALLHGIRLMWVEFSSKFYAGMGFEFKPTSTKKALILATSPAL
ncbi:vacuolar ATPase transmembrane subunit [Tritrichomonas foetus]|uniref:V-type proton ATPase subunit a n=1 Tax=Tritrichomonas foetus TaxID=1144522 RepID=A0A1J4KQR2_9EUKA|nr:vacuolar ATPase transmembrane subunit [Tritrichomonas foetus]|eukprot:OHT13595.1 vacuolar ATPase transmembrane subunit [Tritrichomonas foetus]